MKGVMNWIWGAATGFGMLAIYERTLVTIDSDFAIGACLVTVLSLVAAFIMLAFKISEHWNCKGKS